VGVVVGFEKPGPVRRVDRCLRRAFVPVAARVALAMQDDTTFAADCRFSVASRGRSDHDAVGLGRLGKRSLARKFCPICVRCLE